MSTSPLHFRVCGRPDKSIFSLSVDVMEIIRREHTGTRREVTFDTKCFTPVDWERYTLMALPYTEAMYYHAWELGNPSDSCTKGTDTKPTTAPTRNDLKDSGCVVLQVQPHPHDAVGGDNIEALWLGCDFIAYAKKRYAQCTFPCESAVQSSYEQRQLRFLRERGNVYVWLDVAGTKKEGSNAVELFRGRVTLELYPRTCPLTVENFRQLVRSTGAVSYKGSYIHRIIPGGFLQGGDNVHKAPRKAGTGGKSIYGDRMNDECFDIPHEQEGMLGMANDGPHTAASQFYITLAPAQWMNRRYVAFGRVIDGYETIQRIAEVPTRANQTPLAEIQIVECGEMTV